MSIVYRLEKNLPLEDVAELYRAAGWLKADEPQERLAPMLRNSFAVMAALEEESGRLLGMMRALSDGCSDAYLLDLVVRKDMRRRGIGRELVTRLAGHLASSGVEWIVCVGAPGTDGFYARTPAHRMDGYLPYRWLAGDAQN